MKNDGFEVERSDNRPPVATIAGAAHSLREAPSFVGRRFWYAYQQLKTQRSGMPFSYMTAKEIQLTVAALTGFFHPAFDTYGDVLGRFDPATGTRTTDRPTLLSILLMKKICEQIGALVIERETFLDDDERIVFQGMDFQKSPTLEVLDALIQALHERWLGQMPALETRRLLNDAFRDGEARGRASEGYSGLLILLLQHGALYYY